MCLVKTQANPSPRIINSTVTIGTESWENAVLTCSGRCNRLTKAVDHAGIPIRHLSDQRLVRYHSSVTSLSVLLTNEYNSGCIKTNPDPFCVIK